MNSVTAAMWRTCRGGTCVSHA